MMFGRKKKKRKYYIPDSALEGERIYRFTFVGEGSSYYSGYVVEISENISTTEKAFFIACEIFKKRFSNKDNSRVAVFYGDVESPDCEDTLYGVYNSFDE